MMAGVVVEESQPSPHRPPVLIALLIAAVSSVTPSPFGKLAWIVEEVSLAYRQRRSLSHCGRQCSQGCCRMQQCLDVGY